MENASNFDDSFKFFERELTQEELYAFLKTGNLAEKQLACIRIEKCTSEEEAQILMENLTGIDGKVREAVSFKLRSFTAQRPELFLKKEFYDIFLEAIIDINGNICRNVITSLETLKNNPEFCIYFIEKIANNAQNVLQKIENFNYKDRKYVTNKEVFKLYWYLETLSIFKALPEEKILPLLVRSAKIEEYTIREKIAALLSKLPPHAAENFKGLNYDNNFYVSLALGR